MINKDEDRFKIYLENSDIAIFSFDSFFKIVEANSKFCELIGYTRQELSEFMFPRPFWPEEFFINLFNEIESFEKTGRLKIETYFCRKDHSFFPIRMRGCFIPETENNKPEYIVLVDDISAEKKTEREFRLTQDMLVSLNNKLKKMVDDRTQQLQEVMKKKNEFINQLGHDLKNPLTPLITFIPILNNETKDDRCSEIFEVLSRNVKYMKEIITRTIELANTCITYGGGGRI